eukprot:343891-Pelagomonas_calceolata.AAC.1
MKEKQLTKQCVYQESQISAGIASNERADATTKFQENQANGSVADTGIPGTGPGGNPFSHSFWLDKEEKDNKLLAHP